MKATKASDRDRKDWVLLLLFLPFGVLLMLFAGRKATQLLQYWNLRADMGSSIDPNGLPPGSNSFGAVRPEIGTPASWNDTFLTPQPDNGVIATQPTFVVFDPSAAPSASPTPTASPTTTVTTTTTVTFTATKTKKPKGGPTSTATALPTASPPVTSTVVPGYVLITPAPASLNVGIPDGNIASPADGTYYVINAPVIVNGPSDTDYDLAYYESDTGGSVQMDWIIVGITNDPAGITYYEVFNWGNNLPDRNSNVNTDTLADPPTDPANPEADNEPIATSELYQDPSAPSSPQTGILIDVDNAPSNPSPGIYNYVVVISPVVPAQSPPSPASDTSAQIDSVQVTDVPP
jgi:hypothetical protein